MLPYSGFVTPQLFLQFLLILLHLCQSIFHFVKSRSSSLTACVPSPSTVFLVISILFRRIYWHFPFVHKLLLPLVSLKVFFNSGCTTFCWASILSKVMLNGTILKSLLEIVWFLVVMVRIFGTWVIFFIGMLLSIRLILSTNSINF